MESVVRERRGASAVARSGDEASYPEHRATAVELGQSRLVRQVGGALALGVPLLFAAQLLLPARWMTWLPGVGKHAPFRASVDITAGQRGADGVLFRASFDDEDSTLHSAAHGGFDEYPVVDPALCRGQDVLAFVRAHGGRVDGVGFKHFPSDDGRSRRGLAAARPLSEGAVAVAVPPALCLSADRAARDPAICAVVTRAICSGGIDEFTALTVRLRSPPRLPQPSRSVRHLSEALRPHVPPPQCSPPLLAGAPAV